MNRNPFHQTIDDLRALRHEALGYALAMYRREQACDPRNRQRMEWTLARIYWTTRAFHYHGEIMARLERPEFPVYVGWDGRKHAEF